MFAWPSPPTKRNAFTLPELLAVLAIMAVLIALLVQAVQKVRAASDRIVCQNRLRQIGLAVHSYHETNGQRLPNGTTCYVGADGTLADDEISDSVTSWTDGTSTIFYLLLPYIDQLPLYQQGNCTHPAVRATVVEAFLCPANIGMTNQYGKLTHQDSYSAQAPWLNRQGNAHGSYAANAMIFPEGNMKPGSIATVFQDGTSNTVMLAERYHVCYTPADGTGVGWSMPGWADTSISSWDWPLFGLNQSANLFYPGFSSGQLAFQTAPNWFGMPVSEGCDYKVVQGPHPDAIMVGLGDGSVRSLKASMSVATWVKACQPADGSPLGSDW